MYYKAHFKLKQPTINRRRFLRLCPSSNTDERCDYSINHRFSKRCSRCNRRKFKNLFASILCKKSSFKNID